jgi:flagellar biosynthetic protein FliP
MKIRKAALVLFLLFLASFLSAQEAPSGLPNTQGNSSIPPPPGQGIIPFIDLTIRNPQNANEVAFSVRLLLLVTVISLAPSIVILTTSFLRVSIVLDFVRRALSLQSVPPTQVIMGISLFLTLFIMWPTFDLVYQNSFRPLADGEINVEQAYREAEGPMRLFMLNQMNSASGEENLGLFMAMRGLNRPANVSDVPTYIIIPAFILNELTIAFKIGILLFVPFIVIDMVVASILMSMGMIMLPPIMISMPFKLTLFILVDGWGLLTSQVAGSFF